MKGPTSLKFCISAIALCLTGSALTEALTPAQFQQLAQGAQRDVIVILRDQMPNVPPARIEALRRAFDATMKDPAYLAEADKLKIDVEPLSGEQVAALVEQVFRTPADTVARVRAALENR